jgi:hypothetical protein
MNIVWTYWEDRPGVPTPPHILLCREILDYKCKECEVRLVTPVNVHQYLPDLDPRIWRISLENQEQNPIAIRCDFIRAFLLERFGGLYVDADCIALRDYAEAFRASAGYEFFAMRRISAKSNHISIGFYGTQSNGKVITAYAEALRKILKEKTQFKWAEVGAHLLTPIVDQHLDSVFLFREEQIHPIVAEKQELLVATDKEVDDLVPKEALCLMLFHRIFEQEVRGASLSNAALHNLYYSDWFISKVVRTVYPQKSFERTFGCGRSTEIIEPSPGKPPYIATGYETEKLIERIGYWIPPGGIGPQENITPRTNLKIAAILEERLYQGIRHEAQVMLLTPNNWKATIQYGKPDFLLMESIWTTATGHWHMAQCPPAAERNKLLEVVSLARQKDIPSVFWMTKNNVYHEHYRAFARHFDFVFCADPIEAEKMRNEGVNAELLLPCARQVENIDRKDRTIPILFDGWADLDKYTADLDDLKSLKPFGLKIIESRYQIFKRRAGVLADYKEQIVGCVSRQGRLAALAAANCYITFDKTLSTTTTQQWMAMEAIGLGAMVFHIGEMGVYDPGYSIVRKVKRVDKIIPVISSGHDNQAFLIAKQLTFGDRLARIISAVRHQEYI